MAHRDVPAVPSASDIADILEAALLANHAGEAPHRSGASTVHLSTPDNGSMPSPLAMLAAGP